MTPFLKTPERLLSLQPLVPWDGHMIHRCVVWLGKPEIVKFSEQRHANHTWKSQLEYVSSFDGDMDVLWKVCRDFKGDSQPIGTVSAHIDPNNSVANVGIMIGEAAGHGYGTIAWQLACDWLLTWVRKVEAGCMEPNKAMLRIFEKTGMEIEGRIKNHFMFEGNPVDMILAGRMK